MAFTLKQATGQAPIDNHTEEVFNEDLDFLKQTQDIEKEKPNDLYSAEMTKKSSHQYTLKTLNALKIVSPILCALMEKPGVGAPSKDMSEGFKKLINTTSSLAEKACEKIGVNPNEEKNFWIRNVLERVFSEALNKQWVVNQSSEIEDVEKLIDVVIEYSKNVSEKNEYYELTPIETVALANMKAIMPVISESKTNFNLYRDFEKDIEPIMEKLFNASAQATKQLSDPYADSKHRSELFQIIIQQAGQLYATAWRSEVKKINEIMNTYSEDKISQAIKKYKSNGGFPLNRVDNDFDEYFKKMLIITEKLIKSPKGDIQKRLKA